MHEGLRTALIVNNDAKGLLAQYLLLHPRALQLYYALGRWSLRLCVVVQ